jgi:hypothetical protein
MMMQARSMFGGPPMVPCLLHNDNGNDANSSAKYRASWFSQQNELPVAVIKFS